MHLLFYKDVNLGVITNNRKKRRGRTMAWMKAKGTCDSEVATNHFRIINDKEEDWQSMLDLGLIEQRIKNTTRRAFKFHLARRKAQSKENSGLT